MKVLKPVLVIFGLLLVVAIAGFVYFLSNLDGLVLDAVEEKGSKITGTAVSLDSVSISLSDGSATLNGLVIDNPAGFTTDYAFRLETINVDINSSSVTGSVVLLDDITINGARLNAEQKGTTTNLSVILKNIEAATAGEAPPPDPKDPTDVRLALARFAFTDTEATLATENYGASSLRIPDVVRQNIGDPGTGLTPEELARQLLRAVLKEAQTAVTNHLADLARDAAKDAAKDQLKDKLNISDEKLDSAEGALKSLFKRD